MALVAYHMISIILSSRPSPGIAGYLSSESSNNAEAIT